MLAHNVVRMFGGTGESGGGWVHWNTLVPEFGGLAIEMPSLSTVPLVPTVDTVRTEYFVDILARQGNQVMLVGDHGSAKSLVVRHYLSKKNPDAHLSKTVVFSSATTSATLQVNCLFTRANVIRLHLNLMWQVIGINNVLP